MNTSISRSSWAALGLGLLLLSPLIVDAAPAAELQGYIVGGSANGPGYYFSQTLSPATANSSIVKSLSDTDVPGSYADGRVEVGFGQLHSYSDAHEVSLAGHAPQSNVVSEFIDYVKPWDSSPVGYTAYALTLTLSGSHSLQGIYNGFPGYTAQGSIDYRIVDNRTGDVFASGYYDTTDASPPIVTINATVAPIPPSEATDDLRIDVSLEAYTYVNNGNPAFQTAVADYTHTLVVNLDALTPGASTLGVSGYNYATVAAVPEPSTWLMMFAGVAVFAIRLRTRSAAAS